MGKHQKNTGIDWEKLHHLLDTPGESSLPGEPLNGEEQELLKEIMAVRAQAGELKGWEAVNTADDLAKLKARLSLPATATTVIPIWRKAIRYAAIIFIPLLIAGTAWLFFKPDNHPATGDINYITRETPKDNTPVVLPDGSKIWLNKGSHIRYSPSFTDKDRWVEMTGEGYFEVATNTQKPFIVKVNSQIVRVLGTSFNINAYGKQIITTLMQGKIVVGNIDEPAIIQHLLPGQQAGYDTLTRRFYVGPGNPETALAWKSGQIAFTDVPLDDLMVQLGLQYDYRIIFTNKQFNALHYNVPVMQKPENILPLLELIKASTASHINFNIDTSHRTIEIK